MSVRRYETTFITHPDLTEEDLDKITQKAMDAIQSHKGEVFQAQQWGKKRLAYTIKKQTRGGYTLLDYTAGGDAVREMERGFRLDDKVLKFLTVMVDPSVDPEAVRESFAREAKPVAAAAEETAGEEAAAEGAAAPSEAATEAKEEQAE
jgi:small subunit ribosomal protein S6